MVLKYAMPDTGKSNNKKCRYLPSIVKLKNIAKNTISVRISARTK